MLLIWCNGFWCYRILHVGLAYSSVAHTIYFLYSSVKLISREGLWTQFPEDYWYIVLFFLAYLFDSGISVKVMLVSEK